MYSKCNKVLRLDCFSNRKISPDGKQSRCKDCMKQSYSEWKTRCPDNYEYHWRRHNRLFREKVLTVVGRGKLVCNRCGCDKFELLEINHVNCGGLAEVSRKNQRFYKSILDGHRSIDDLEILCKLCNILHYIEFKHGKQPYILEWRPSNE